MKGRKRSAMQTEKSTTGGGGWTLLRATRRNAWSDTYKRRGVTKEGDKKSRKLDEEKNFDVRVIGGGQTTSILNGCPIKTKTTEVEGESVKGVCSR